MSPRIYLGISILGHGLRSMRQESVAEQLTAYKAQGYHFIIVEAREMYARDTIPIVDSFVAAARRVGLPLATHDHETQFEKVLALSVAGGSSEHMYPFKDLLMRPETDVSTAEIQARAAAAQRAGARITVTLVCTRYGEPRVVGNINTARRVVKALQDAGVKMLLGSDMNGGRGASPGIVHTELALLVEAGLTPYEALVTGTRNVAEHLGVSDSGGTVAVGKWADLVLLNGNPLTDVRRAREPAGVMIRGHWLDRAALDQRLLASPSYWFTSEVWGGLLPPKPYDDEFRKVRRQHLKQFNALTDSLVGAKLAGRREERTSQRLLQQLTDALGTMRTILTPEQHEVFDPQARVWMREQARQGYRMTIPGVAAAR